VVGALLLSVFVFRVGAQLIQFFSPTPLLPAFEEWHSATLPYPVLVAAQLAIIAVSTLAMAGIGRGRGLMHQTIGKVLFVIGIVYIAGAVFRLIAGFTMLAGMPFFSAHLPAFFHVVLAGLVLTFGDYYRRPQT